MCEICDRLVSNVAVQLPMQFLEVTLRVDLLTYGILELIFLNRQHSEDAFLSKLLTPFMWDLLMVCDRPFTTKPFMVNGLRVQGPPFGCRLDRGLGAPQGTS